MLVPGRSANVGRPNSPLANEMPGFATIVVKEVEIVLNRRTTMPLQLSAGQVQTVTVTAQAPLIDMKQTSIGANVKVVDVELAAEDLAALDATFPPPKRGSPLGMT